VRREFAAEHAHLLVIIARLHPEKGHHYLFQALPEIRRRVRRPVRLVVAGEGPFEAAYTEEVRALGCEDMVIFTGFRHDAPDLMAASDIVVLPSVAEAFGLVLTEALYLGTPVVATRVGGIPEIVEDGVDGTLVVPGDSAALAEAIITLLSDSQRLESMRGAGREKVINRFQFERMVRAYEALYERMTDTRKATPGDQTPVQFTRKPERTDS
jgi:glycosyltransferase involved in cell wall biosynthesis